VPRSCSLKFRGRTVGCLWVAQRKISPNSNLNSLVTESGLAVFDSEVSSQTVCDVENAEETRKESSQPFTKHRRWR